MSLSQQIEELFELCASLHVPSNNGSSTALSLEQLIPVHQALIQAFLTAKDYEYEHEASNLTKINNEMFEKYISDSAPQAGEEEDLTDERTMQDKQVAFSSLRDKRMLLLFQYQLWYCRNHYQNLEKESSWWSNLVLPKLLHANISHNLCEALLTKSLLDPPSQMNLQLILSQIKMRTNTSEDIAGACIETVVRIFMRLSTHSYPDEISLDSAIYSYCFNVIESNTSLQNPSRLRPINAWLLPRLCERYRHRDAEAPEGNTVLQIWNRLLGLYHPQDNESSATKKVNSLLRISSVLCTIAPHLDEQITANQGNVIWILILELLQRSTYYCGSASDDRNPTYNRRDDEILRRRGLYLLQHTIIATFPGDEKSNSKDDLSALHLESNWMQKYCSCFETLEMEAEQHLMDQVWDTVAELCQMLYWEPQQCPRLSWEWMGTMLCRLFFSESPVLRKLGLYRFLNGNAGIETSEQPLSSSTNDKAASVASSLLQPPKKKHAIKAKKSLASRPAPLSMIPSDFVVGAILPSYDTLTTSVGTNMQFEERGKIKTQDLTPRAAHFVTSYVSALAMAANKDNTLQRQLGEFMALVLRSDLVCNLRPKTIVLVFKAVANALKESVSADAPLVPITCSTLENVSLSLQRLFGTGSVVVTFRESLLDSLATILSYSQVESALDPRVLLKVLSLYPLDLAERNQQALLDHPTYASLERWVQNMHLSKTTASLDVAAATFASAFVNGNLSSTSSSEWDPFQGCTETDRSFGASIVLFSALAATSSASQLLWPAVHKGLSLPAPPSAELFWMKAVTAARSLILLEYGCKLEILGGIGNGDLLVDRKTQQMMPPPPNIEKMLSIAVGFILNHVCALTSRRTKETTFKHEDAKGEIKASGSTRSGDTNRISAMFATLINQLKVLHEAFPSSMSVSKAVDEMLESNVQHVMDEEIAGIDVVTHCSLAYGALSCGAEQMVKGFDMIAVCHRFLSLEFQGNINSLTKSDEQTARSIFHYSRWGVLSCILPKFLEKSEQSRRIIDLLETLFDTSHKLVEATPLDALVPLFHCVVTAANSWLVPEMGSKVFVVNLKKIILSLFSILNDVSSSLTNTYMLNKMCSLIFQPRLVMDEFQRLQENCEYEAPIRDAFRKLLKMAGTTKPFMSRAVLCQACAAWLGTTSNEDVGLGAIPYREMIPKLLIHKELISDESSTNQSDLLALDQASESALTLPRETDDASVARGFVLVFFSRLPDPHKGMDYRVLFDLIHFVILGLIDEICRAPLKNGSMLMIGTDDYVIRIRAWQALCVLSRFVTSEIADEVLEKVFECFGQNLHGQIRYFLENFAIQIARKHGLLFKEKFVREIKRVDLTLQHISSLMVTGGNLIVGRYKQDFKKELQSSANANMEMRHILSGVLPWLSSTQGFSRGLAQLLVHDLIPLVVDIDATFEEGSGDWLFNSIYQFLDKNPETRRLRRKQPKVFDRYDADEMARVESLLSIKVDESREANPVHVVDAIKKCLEEVYLESHEHEAPLWKQVNELMKGSDLHTTAAEATESSANFQRKIIPLDSLEATMEESRSSQLRNASGRKRQSLIICASLIDKVPNLGGLARTAEIFAAEQLVVPDKNVTRMDNFKSISVGAGDWIDITECKEQQLVAWLGQKKRNGYAIVGLEQTTSSTSIESMEFADKTVLLLGKEKEGIPVELLSYIDSCIEIPQFGIIRSLNVHVSGAITIWEYTKQMMERAKDSQNKKAALS